MELLQISIVCTFQVGLYIFFAMDEKIQVLSIKVSVLQVPQIVTHVLVGTYSKVPKNDELEFSMSLLCLILFHQALFKKSKDTHH